MKNSLLPYFLLCIGVSFAQSDVFVSGGSFIYVDGTAFSSGPDVAPLYVTDDINLAANGHIYLRNEAQLLQGNDVGNSGQGELSVYQEGNSNQWEYNYWCSPVGGILASTAVNNAFRIDQIDDPRLSTSDPIDSNDSVFTSAYNGTASPLLISDRWLWTYQTSSLYADWAYAGPAGNINPGLGFTMKGNGIVANFGDTTYDFRGKPNNGTITNPVSDGDFTLVGNPYPSAIDSAALIHDPDNVSEILGTLFYWEQDTSIPLTQSHVLQDYVGGYSEFTIDPAGVIVSNTFAIFFKYDEQDNTLPLPPGPPALGSKLAERYIPIGQGFMVEGVAGPNNEVSFKNAHRIFEKEGLNSVFFRSEDAPTTSSNTTIQFQDNGLPLVPEDYMRFRINVEFTVNSTKYVRQMLLNFHDTATMGHDRGLELHRSENLNSDAYFEQEDDIFSGLAFPFNDTLHIPLIVDIEEQQPLRFRIFDIQNFDETQGIFIHDLENDTYVNLRNQNYDINIEPGHYTERFEIVFTSESALNVSDFDSNALAINQNNGIKQLSVFNTDLQDVTSISIFDSSGKRLVETAYASISERYDLSTANLSDGVYIVKVSSDQGLVKSQKVIIKN